MNNFCSNVGHSVSLAYHSLEAMQPGLGKGVAQTSVGASMAATGAGALLFRTAVCYAAERGMTCGSPLTIPVAAATFMLIAGGWTVKVGLQNIVKGNTGDRTASAVIAADRFGQLTGHGDLGTRAKSMYEEGQKTWSAASELYQSTSNGLSAAMSWWYGTPVEAPAPQAPVKSD